MKHSMLKAALIIATTSALFAVSNGDGWSNLKSVTKEHDYDFVSRDGSCVSGRIVSVADNSVTVKIAKSNVKLNRADLMRVSSGPGYIIYSGRSSWADFSSYHLGPGESVVITSKDGSVKNSKRYKTSDSAITIQDSGADVTIAKAEVANIDLISDRPLPDGDRYWLQECAITATCALDFHLWPRFVGIGGTMRVRLYDATLPEDNSPIDYRKR